MPPRIPPHDPLLLKAFEVGEMAARTALSVSREIVGEAEVFAPRTVRLGRQAAGLATRAVLAPARYGGRAAWGVGGGALVLAFRGWVRLARIIDGASGRNPKIFLPLLMGVSLLLVARGEAYGSPERPSLPVSDRGNVDFLFAGLAVFMAFTVATAIFLSIRFGSPQTPRLPRIRGR